MRPRAFDGVLAYSHCAQLVASIMIRMHRESPSRQPFTWAIYSYLGGVPYESSDSSDGKLWRRRLTRDGVVIHTLTANIWGSVDQLYPGTSEALTTLCQTNWSEIFVHEKGYGIPGAKGRSAVIGSVRAIRWTIDLALSMQ